MADEAKQPIIIKKKKVGAHGAHGGAWKLAYADFVTAMMAFFLVMWIIGLDVKTKSAIAEYFSNPGAFKVKTKTSQWILQFNGKPPLDNDTVRASVRTITNVNIEAANAFAALLNLELENEPRAQAVRPYVEIFVGDKGLIIELHENTEGVFFTTGSAEAKPGARALIQALAGKFIGAKKKLTIEGHLDRRPLAGGASRMELSGQRAMAIRKTLEDSGLSPALFSQIVARGDQVPKDGVNLNNPENSRVNIVVPFEAE